MNVLTATIGGIGELDEAIMESCQQRLDALTKPVGSLAILEKMARQLAGVRAGVCLPPPRKAIVLMAADHGVADEGVSAFPSEVTAQMVLNFVNGGAAINVLARHADARLVLVDVGVKTPLPLELPIRHRRIRPGTANMRNEAAMTRQEAIRAIETGIQIANELAEEGVEVIALGEMGIGNTTASSAVTAVLTAQPVSKVVGKGTGIAPEFVAHKIKVIHDAVRVNRPDPRDAIDVLAKVGGLEIAALAGVALGAARRRMVIMLDGFIASAAVLAAYRLSEKIKPFLMASHLSEEPGHAVILKELGLEPCLRLNMRLGEGSGAALGLTLLDAAAKIVTEMATFEEAQVASSAQHECKTVVNQ